VLSYAEWLRRQRRIAEARPLLATASEVFRQLRDLRLDGEGGR
jgi:hypothetical protein